MTKMYTKALEYNDKGNEVSFDIDHLKNLSNTQPGLFQNEEIMEVKEGDTVFEEGEPSNFLY